MFVRRTQNMCGGLTAGRLLRSRLQYRMGCRRTIKKRERMSGGVENRRLCFGIGRALNEKRAGAKPERQSNNTQEMVARTEGGGRQFIPTSGPHRKGGRAGSAARRQLVLQNVNMKQNEWPHKAHIRIYGSRGRQAGRRAGRARQRGQAGRRA